MGGVADAPNVGGGRSGRYDNPVPAAGGPVKELTFAVVFLAGATIAVQAAINARLGQALGNGMHAVLVSFVIGTVGALLYCLVGAGPIAPADALKAGPWWMWTGGLLGVA